jgi:hypothetical protein
VVVGHCDLLVCDCNMIRPCCEHVTMMGQAIEESGGQLFLAEDFDPFAESQIGGDDSRVRRS